MIAEKSTLSFNYTSLNSNQQKCIHFNQSRQRLNSRNKIYSFQKSTYKNHIIKKFRKNNPKRVNQQEKFSDTLNEKSSQMLEVNDYTCPICLQIMINPIVFECGHFGCMKCIQTVAVYQNKCFLCRQTLSNLQYNPSRIIQTIINKNIINNTQNIIQYYSRYSDHLKWYQNKKIDLKSIEQGSLIDIKCQTTGKWKVGCVLEIIKLQNEQFSFLIKYTNSQGSTKQLIQQTSNRLAKLGFFTQKKSFQPIQNDFIREQSEVPEISNDFTIPTAIQTACEYQAQFQSSRQISNTFQSWKLSIDSENLHLYQNDVYSLQIQQYLNPSWSQHIQFFYDNELQQIQL